MIRPSLPSLLLVSFLLTGCWPQLRVAEWQGGQTQLVGANPFRSSAVAPAAGPKSSVPAAVDVAARVDLVGRNLLAANPQLGVKPLFLTIGVAHPELFHRGTAEINITEGLVRQCQTDSQLAAVLSLELGRMMSEREALASPWTRMQERQPSLSVDLHGDNGADRTRLAEMARYEQDRQRSVASPPLPPQPEVLARCYLGKAGFAESELDSILPLLKAASTNSALEKQLNTPGNARPWTQ